MNYKEIPDNILFEKISQSNILAFDTLFIRYYKKLCYYSNKITRKHDLSQELVQDVFVKIWKNRESLHIKKSVKLYLYRSVYNLSLNAVRDNKKQNDFVQIDSVCLEQDSCNYTDDDILVNELETRLFETINTFPEKQKLVFLLKRFDGLSYKEISVELNISMKMVEKYIGKALAALRKELSEYNNLIPGNFIFFL